MHFKLSSLFIITLFLSVLLIPSVLAITSKQSGNWNDPTTWDLNRIPTTGDNIAIAAGHTVTYNVISDAVLGEVNIAGTLRFARDVNTRLKTNDNIMVMMGGFLDMGTSTDFIPKTVKAEVIFVLTQAQANAYVGGFNFQPTDKGLWAMDGSRWEVYGSPLTRTWSKLASDALAGSTSVIVENNVADWYVGGTVVITQTSNPAHYRIRPTFGDEEVGWTKENEIRTIQSLEKLADGKTKITLDKALTFKHDGTSPFQGEAVLLTRNILLKTELLGVSESSFVSDVRTRKFAHTMKMQNSKGNIQYAEFKYMGNYGTLSRYAIHLHQMLDSSKGMVIRGNSGWYNGFRCLNLHVTHGVLVEDNVCYSSSSVSYFVEPDPIGFNEDNAFVHNIGIGMQPKHFDDRSNSAIAGERGRAAVDFWPGQNTINEAFLGNVAVGGDLGGSSGVGTTIGTQGFHFPEIANGLKSKGTMPFTFVHNEVHSKEGSGIFTWQNIGNSRDLVDSLFWRNGYAGIAWGAYGEPDKYFNAQFLENGISGLAITSVNTFLQDSTVTGLASDNSAVDIGYNIGSYIGTQYPTHNIWIVRNTFKDLKTSGITQNHDPCTDTANEGRPAIAGACSPVYTLQMGNTFVNVNKLFDFGWQANKNVFWRVFDYTGLGTLPKDFVLLRKDQSDPAKQTTITKQLVNGQTFYSSEFDALVTPMSSLPATIDYTNLPNARAGFASWNYKFTTIPDYPPKISLDVTMNGKTATLKANAADDKGVTKVEFFKDWELIATKTAPPYETTVDLSAHPREYAYLYARAFDGTKQLWFIGDNGIESPYDQRAYSNVIELGPEVILAGQPIPTPLPPPTITTTTTTSTTTTSTTTTSPTPTPLPSGSISFRSTSTATNGAGATTLSLNVPAGVQQGDVLVAQIVVNSATTTVIAPSGWNTIIITQSSSSIKEASFYKVASAAELTSYSWIFGSSQPAIGGMSSYIGVDPTAPVDASSGKYNNGTATVGFVQITTTTPNDMLLAFVGVSGHTTVTPPAGFTENYDVTNAASANGKSIEMSQAFQSTAGITTVGNGLEDSLSTDSNLAQLIALKPITLNPTTTTTTSPPVSVATTTTTTTSPTTTTTSPPASVALFEAHFDTNTDGFAYIDDTFRGTNKPTYAKGDRVSSSGFTGGGIRVTLGGVDNNTIRDMSGGWRRTFTLTSPMNVTLSFHYKMSQSSVYKSDEFSQVLLTVDTLQPGTGGKDFIAQIVGGGTTNWQTFQVNLGTLASGNHVLTIGGYNNKKTAKDEVTKIIIDDVIATGLPEILASNPLPFFASLAALFTDKPEKFTILGTNFPIGEDFSFTLVRDEVDKLTFTFQTTNSSNIEFDLSSQISSLPRGVYNVELERLSDNTVFTWTVDTSKQSWILMDLSAPEPVPSPQPAPSGGGGGFGGPSISVISKTEKLIEQKKDVIETTPKIIAPMIGNVHVDIEALDSTENGEPFKVTLILKSKTNTNTDILIQGKFNTVNYVYEQARNQFQFPSEFEAVFDSKQTNITLTANEEKRLAFDFIVPSQLKGGFSIEAKVTDDADQQSEAVKPIAIDFKPLVLEAIEKQLKDKKSINITTKSYTENSETELKITRNNRETVFFELIKGKKEYNAEIELLKPGVYEIKAIAKSTQGVIDEDVRYVAVAGEEQFDYGFIIPVIIAVVILAMILAIFLVRRL